MIPTTTAELPLADRFRLRRAPIVAVDGDRVRAEFALPVPRGATLRVSRRFASTERPQGLRLSSPVDLLVNGHRARDITLWSTNSPERTDIDVLADRDISVRVWNMWRADGIDHAWLANAGMLVETDLTGPDPAAILWCSDGEGDVSFDDLVVAIEILLPKEPATAHVTSITGTTSA